MDNKIVRINGSSKEKLKKIIELMLMSEYSGKSEKVVGYRVSNQHGLIFYTSKSNHSDYKELGVFNQPDDLLRLATKYLFDLELGVNPWEFETLFDQDTENIEADGNFDGSASQGWLVYTDKWGKIGGEYGTLFAVKPCWCWYSK